MKTLAFGLTLVVVLMLVKDGKPTRDKDNHRDVL